MADRTLKLVTKSIQNLANLVEFKAKESFMIYLNPFIKEYMPKMRQFVNQLAVSLVNTHTTATKLIIQNQASPRLLANSIS